MQLKKLFAGLAIAAVLAGCQWNDLERAGAGAATGAVIAGVANGNVLTGAAIGAGAGALCDDVGAC
ncbi:hypothetical protein K3X41_03255 [Aliiroseovarius crassostreae]|uniref:YMGG-like Gly-zipper domain-containing protein n=1 Tax=Aliiroseovarius crassostreae TaxID=154981 RepID=A0A9Q9LVL3_9RHOB|nr:MULTISPECIES: hypothetical protein [Aliiroseovarius]UWP89731.1 hypothetical protein K3J57_03290 [Aliiroseovarius crassostreae]UWP92873.1 hypothetical protein K3X13_03200 [Aliiroseovarius crassostreae]UWP96016.1 hypothetical protein K3X48_03200 [Aliiroseovarius crassostreae]UWP99185.1 hypothetical protein K3X53_03250 [Aliiroseovarius crassostreae]UWQ02381.1 hypothetical protein K3X44_03295 [Aliiroseovarius crassostreae]